VTSIPRLRDRRLALEKGRARNWRDGLNGCGGPHLPQPGQGKGRGGAKMEGRRLCLCERFQSPLDDLFGRAIRPARKLLLQPLFAVGCRANGIHEFTIREASDSAQPGRSSRGMRKEVPAASVDRPPMPRGLCHSRNFSELCKTDKPRTQTCRRTCRCNMFCLE
jgi:hypothetical protein